MRPSSAKVRMTGNDYSNHMKMIDQQFNPIPEAQNQNEEVYTPRDIMLIKDERRKTNESFFEK